MSFKEIQFDEHIIDVSFLEQQSAAVKFAVLQKTAVSVFEWSFAKLPLPSPVSVAPYKALSPSSVDPADSFILWPRQVSFSDPDHLIVLGEDIASTILCRLVLKGSTLQLVSNLARPNIKEIVSSPIQSHLSCLWLRGNVLVRADEKLVDNIGRQYPYKIPEETEDVAMSTNISSSTSDADASLDPPVSIQVTFALTRRGLLYADDICLARDCTSFVATVAHLIFTTSQHLIKFVHMGKANGRSSFLASDKR